MRKYSVEKIPYTIYVHQGNGVSQSYYWCWQWILNSILIFYSKKEEEEKKAYIYTNHNLYKYPRDGNHKNKQTWFWNLISKESNNMKYTSLQSNIYKHKFKKTTGTSHLQVLIIQTILSLNMQIWKWSDTLTPLFL